MKKINKLLLIFIILITITIFTSCENNKREELSVLADVTLQPILKEIEKSYEKSNKELNLVITYGNYEELSNIIQANKSEYLVIADKRRLRYLMDENNCSYERKIVDFARNVECKTTENDAKIATIYSAGIIDTNYKVFSRSEDYIDRTKLESPNYDKTIANYNSFIEYLTNENCQAIYTKHDLTIKEEVTISKGEYVKNILTNEDSSLELYVNVYLPPNYSENTKPYKVIYFQDGDFYLELKNTYDKLISENEIEPFIGVFIHIRKANYNRNSALSNNPQFTSFVGNDVVKFIRENYNISIKPEDNIAAGLSLGAFESFVLAYKYPDVFKSVISQSIGMGMESFSYYVENDKNDASDKNFYIENGQSMMVWK